MTRSIALFSIVLTGTAVILTGAMWILTERSRGRAQTESAASEYLETKKTLIRGRVDDTVDLLGVEIEYREQEMLESLRSRVGMAVAISENLVTEFGNSRSEAELQTLVIETLRPIRFDGGRGYFFAVSFAGVELLYPTAPSLEGELILDLADVEGTLVVREEIQTAAGGGGFVEGIWGNPVTGETEPKISYVAPVPTLDMYVGTGAYRSSIRGETQQALMNILPRIPIDSDEYVFAGTFDGVSIMGPRSGENMWDATDSDGLFVVRELVERARDGGGFVEYRLPEETGFEPIEKMSYVKSIPSLDWYIGVGFNIETVSENVSALQRQTVEDVRAQSVVIGGALAILLTITSAIVTLFVRRVRQNFDSLLRFANGAATSRLLVEPESLPFEEFRELATATNSMVNDLRASVDEKATLLREIHHRVKNNLQVVVSILSLQRASVSLQDEPAYIQTQQRVSAMALVHEHLYESVDSAAVNLREYAETLVSYLVGSFATVANPVRHTLECDDVRLDLDQAVPVGLIMTELITNAIKHGSVNGSTPPAVKTQIRNHRDHVGVTIEDDGPGLAAKAMDGGFGLGLKLTETLVQQLHGEMRQVNDEGCRWEISFPLHPDIAAGRRRRSAH